MHGRSVIAHAHTSLTARRDDSSHRDVTLVAHTASLVITCEQHRHLCERRTGRFCAIGSTGRTTHTQVSNGRSHRCMCAVRNFLRGRRRNRTSSRGCYAPARESGWRRVRRCACAHVRCASCAAPHSARTMRAHTARARQHRSHHRAASRCIVTPSLARVRLIPLCRYASAGELRSCTVGP